VIEIRNLLFQPLTFQLAGEQRGLHLGSRQRKPIDDAQVSDEIRVAAKRGFVALTILEQPDQPEAQSEDVITSPEAAAPRGVEPVADESVQVPDEATTTSEDAGVSTDQPQSKKRR